MPTELTSQFGCCPMRSRLLMRELDAEGKTRTELVCELAYA